ncbi:O-acyltransferase like protein [Hyalella azteca]|uniref:O-acyltransferase like protein n=1 Tax=Hyalella azteca TaxID=294128 RepID=A0A8B7NV29_HYAAZ|nr:O-acyltransferase like protein [Hyalella azteca]
MVGWLVFAVTAAALVFGLSGRNYYHLLGATHSYSDVESFFYASFSSTAWAICVGWLVLTSYCGCGGGLGTLLSHPVWVLPSRVTYSVFVLSLPFHLMISYSVHRFFFVSTFSFVLSYVGITVICFQAAFLISLVAESPYIALSKLARSPRS